MAGEGRAEAPEGTTFEFDVCVLGTGRVGLPLALSLIEAGSSVVGVDLDEGLRDAVNARRMPWHEPGYEAVLASGALHVHAAPEVAARARAIVITVGTPLHRHIESDLRQVRRVLEDLAPHLRPGQLVCLRSTVAPQTMEYVRRWLERHTDLHIGVDLMLAFAPERTAEGRSHDELRTLPQVIGTQDSRSRDMAEALFSRLSPKILHTDWVSAELLKLFTNMVRYTTFAVANQLALVAEGFGADLYAIREMANLDYPREHLPLPGLTAGPCLRKDFGMINERSGYPDLFLAAWKLNEYMPSFLVERALEHAPLHDRRVALLGWTFKADSDDVRDSLSPKLWRRIERELPAEIRVSDHHLPARLDDPVCGPLENWPVDEALDGADLVFVAVAHSGYAKTLERLGERHPDAWVVDLWNSSGRGRIVFRAGELADPGAER